jgi:peroxiredoxin Q/BCP
MASLQVGDRAPLIEAVAHNGERFSLADYRGKQPVVLFFYPKDNTPICTAEACAFRDAYEAFVEAGAVVVGVSNDSHESHRSFAESQRLPYPLLADTDGAIRTAFGVPKLLMVLPGRVTYVIDREGVIRLKFNATLASRQHVDEALRVVRELAKETGSGA